MSEEAFDNDRTHTHIVLTKGTMVSHYRIIERIGAGGMGEVYLAEDTELDRKVALKFLPPHLCQDEDCRTRFKREAQAVAKLSHPNVVTIHEVGEHAGRPYFAMEHIEGQRLRDLISDKSLDLQKVISLAIQLCEGLQEAHEAGIVHRDIKPSNILLGKRGRPRLVDFGLVAIKGAEKLTQTGSTLGTMGYMSPEQIEVKECDQRSDLFSFGVVLYEMISGQKPFEADTEAGTLNAVLNTTPEPLSRYKSGVTGELQRIVDKLLEKDPQLRYQAAAEVLSDLRRIRRDSDSNISAVSAQHRSSRTARIYVPIAVVVLAVLTLVLKPWRFHISSTDDVIAAENRLAIMYFDNLTDSSDSLRLGEIVTNLLITDLSESRYVQVVSSQRLYDLLKQLGHEGERKLDQSVATRVAEKAGAKWMLLGSILSTEPEILITAQLIDLASGDAMASQRIEGEAGERIFPVVDRLTVAVKDDLSLSPEADAETDLSVATLASDSREAIRFYLEGVEMGERHYWSEADKLFAKAIEIDSTYAMAHYRRASLAYWTEDAAAKEHIAKAMKYSDHAGDKARHYMRSLDARLNQDYARSVEEMERIISRYPDEKDAYLVIGLTKRFMTGEFQEAIENFEKVIELDPYNREAYNQLAYVYDELDQFEKAIWAINKYIQIAPDEPNPYDSKGELLAFNGKLDDAITSYQKANELEPGFSRTRLAELHLLRGDYAAAESLYTAAVVDGEKEERSYGRLGLAQILMYQGRFSDGLRSLESGIETDRMELVAESVIAEKVWLKCRALAYTGDIRHAIVYAEEEISALQQYAPYVDQLDNARAYVAWLYTLLGNSETADSIINSLLEDLSQSPGSDSGAYWLARALISQELGAYDSAIVYWDKSRSRAPKGFKNQLHLGISLLRDGHLGEAVTRLERAMDIYGRSRVTWPHLSVEGHYWLAQAYEASGWDDKAIVQYETFLDIWKDADEGLEAVKDARQRLANLKHGI